LQKSPVSSRYGRVYANKAEERSALFLEVIANVRANEVRQFSQKKARDSG